MRLKSWLGVALAAIYLIGFAATYAVYLNRAGTWFADLPVVTAAMPFIFTMRYANGGEFEFAGDMTARVAAAAAFGAALGYCAGWIVETLVRTAIRGLRRRDAL